MKTLYLTRSANIVVDTEDNYVSKLKSERQAIDYIYVVDEPMHIVYGYEDNKYELDADAGDIVITFYEKSFKHPIVLIKSEEWKENIFEYRKKEQEEKERWAAQCDNCKSID